MLYRIGLPSNAATPLAVGGRVVRMCLVNFEHRGLLLLWITVGQGPTALTVDAGGVLTFFSHLSFLFSFSLSLGDGPL